MDKYQLNFQKAAALVEKLYQRRIKVPQPHEIDKIIDPATGNMLLYHDSWGEEHRTYGCYLHFKVKNDGKVWVKNEGTDYPVVDELLEIGIDPKDIVIAWHHPSARQYTEFAEG